MNSGKLRDVPWANRFMRRRCWAMVGFFFEAGIVFGGSGEADEKRNERPVVGRFRRKRCGRLGEASLPKPAWRMGWKE
jgi:hypothetical protein